MKVFLGGTVNGSNWRDLIIPRLKVDYFNPVVETWNEEARLQEIEERELCDFCLYVITPRMEGFYSIAEVADDSFKKNDKTIYCYLPKDGEFEFDQKQLDQLKQLGHKIQKNGAIWKQNLDEVVDFLNSANELENSPLLRDSEDFKNVFISYGRRNSLAFAHRLSSSLQARGYKVWFDMNDIPLGVDFQAQIDEGIQRADNFIYIISPHSINSIYCQKEINLALKYHKRIIPIMHVEPLDTITWENIHDEIGRRNWIYSRQHEDAATSLSAEVSAAKGIIANWDAIQWKMLDDFDQSLENLVNLLDIHRDFVRKHTKLLHNTVLWEKNQRNTQHLLVGLERIDAEQWLQRSHHFFHNTGGQATQPPCLPTNQMAEYIMESKKNGNNLQSDVFVCHAAEDRVHVDKIAAALHKHGFSTWFHDRDIQKGSNFDSAIENGLVQSANMVLFVTQNALQSEYCKKEYLHAIKFNKRIIPVLISDSNGNKIPDTRAVSALFENADNLGFSGLSKLQFIQYTQLENEPLRIIRTRDEVAELEEVRHNKTQFELSTDELVNTLNTERNYYEEHRMFLVQSLRWLLAEQKQSFLLQGFNLDNAATWLRMNISRPIYAPTEEQIQFIKASEAARGQLGTEVFISYSRKDADFARKLNLSLQSAGHTTWFDQESISKGVDFEKEIFKGISGCDNFVFIISPDSVNSPYCKSEVDYALEQNKRIITILWRSVDVHSIPEALRLINWFDFEKELFDKSLLQLVQEVETDREYVHAHTLWQMRAQDWHLHGRSRDYLLNTNACLSAEAWLANAAQNPVPTQMQNTFISESRKAIKEALLKEEKKRKKLQMYLGLAIVALMLAAAFSIVAIKQYRLAHSEVAKTEKAIEKALENEHKASVASYKNAELLKFFIDENNSDSSDYYTILLKKGKEKLKKGEYKRAIKYFEIAKIVYHDSLQISTFERDSLIKFSGLLSNAVEQADSILSSNKDAAILIYKNILSQNRGDVYVRKKIRSLEGKSWENILDQVKTTTKQNLNNTNILKTIEGLK